MSTAAAPLQSQPEATQGAIISLEGVGRTFPGVIALSDVTFDVLPGEVHALCGENGAGKSTLMRVMAGSFPQNSGTIRYRGETVTFASPMDAKRRGILLIHQEISLVPELSVAENIFLGDFPKLRGGRLDTKKLYRDAERVLEDCGYDLDARAIVGDLSLARQQMVEIARATAFNCSVVIFDEPTGALTNQEAEALFVTIDRLKKRGVGIVYISHKMKEVLTLADRVTVLRDGKVTGTLSGENITEREITRLMIGRSLDSYFHRARRRIGEEVLRLEGFGVGGSAKTVDLSIRAGEIVGLYGLVGAGRSELMEAVFGLRKVTSGKLSWCGQVREISSPKDAVRLGIGLVPEDRKEQGLVLGLGARDNTSMASLRRLVRFGFMDTTQEQSIFDKYRQRLEIKVSTAKTRVGTLSGGNQQKIVLAKWMATAPKLLILDEPTRGIDVNAKAEVHALIGELAESGLAVILISSEMPEIIGLSHRIVTIYQGEVTGDLAAEHVSEDMLVERVMNPPERFADLSIG
ncbi:sugar ABC transporter ATP-binding protein [Mesorhizobium sp. BH1-1-4]|uniref:sugar ABC transporter ATP-binding protein n=1 Tax=Mesorhizobium sp. BH1-1-4 TaxID=2876662 RepID=UPI001CD0909B|nr:sugar ABC transporter ATP-binding protein [Mesorhizobium sp. BH1-1-4]MBZ9994323.1 sugar ABC transporter ATP-binding protein [Mesorhizobium sp. BH1-1-4]